MVTAALLREHLTDRPTDTYALLADGTTVQIRPATPADFDAVKEMHAAMSPDNSYLRFFNVSRLSAEREAERLCLGGTGRQIKPGRMALLALADGRVAGCGGYDEEPGGKAEVAFAVAERMHHRGIATLLLEHLVSAEGRILPCPGSVPAEISTSRVLVTAASGWWQIPISNRPTPSCTRPLLTTDGLGFPGIKGDPARNESGDGDREIGAADASVRALVISAREDIEIARQTHALLTA